MKCDVCGNNNVVTLLNLGRHPLCDDLVEISSKRVCEQHLIEIGLCTICLTAHQFHQVEKKFLFPQSYHYRSRFTVDVLNGMKKLVLSIHSKLGDLSGKKINSLWASCEQYLVKTSGHKEDFNL